MNFLFVCFTIIAFAGFGFWVSNPPPSDKNIVTQFNSTKAIYTRLVTLLHRDTEITNINFEKNSLVYNFMPRLTPVSKERTKLYKELMNQMHIESISRNKDKEVLYFQVWSSHNLFLGGKSKGYVYSEVPPDSKEITKSLDSLYRKNEEIFSYMQIEKNWYGYIDIW